MQLRILIPLIIIQSFTRFSQKAAEMFNLENSYISSLYKWNGSWKLPTSLLASSPVHNNKVLGQM